MLGYLVFLPATYRATTVVVLRPVVTDPFTLPSSGADRAINMTAENGVALGNEVIDATSRILDRDADDVRDALDVEVPTGGQVLRFQYADDTEDQAITGANAAAQTYLRVRQASTSSSARPCCGPTTAPCARSPTSAGRLSAGCRSSPGAARTSTPRTQAMLDQVGALNDQIAQLANQRAKIASADLSPGADHRGGPGAGAVQSRRLRCSTWSARCSAALLIGMIAAHAREALDRRVRSIDQAADLIGVPALGVVRARPAGTPRTPPPRTPGTCRWPFSSGSTGTRTGRWWCSPAATTRAGPRSAATSRWRWPRPVRRSGWPAPRTATRSCAGCCSRPRSGPRRGRGR